MGMRGGRFWDWVIGAAGLALIVSLFLPWYRSNAEDWIGFSSTGIVGKWLLLAGVVALAAPFVATLKPTPGQAQKYDIAVLIVGVLAIAGTILRMANPAEFDTVDEPVTLKAGAWIGLVATIAIVTGAVLALRTRLAQRPARSTA